MELASGYSDAGINAFNANQNMLGNNLMNNISAQQAQQQAMLAQANAYNPFANSGGYFGAQPAYYAGLGAAYGRATGGFNAQPGAVGTISNPGTSNPGYLTGGGGGGGGGGYQPSYGGWGGADDYLRDNPDVNQYAIDHALNAHDFAYQHASTMGANEGRNTYNAPRQYGWDANEGAPAPAAPPTYNKGEFNPQTYGWDHNEGATLGPWEGAGFDAVKYLNAPGNEDLRAANVNPWDHALKYGFNEHRQGLGWNPVDYLNQNIDVKKAGMDPWLHAQKYGFPEGRGGLEGLEQRPDFQQLWEDRGRVYQPPKVESPYGPGGYPTMEPKTPVQQGFLGGSAWATGTPSGTRSAVPDARTYMPSGQFGGYLDRFLWGANSGSLGSGSTFSGYGAQDTSSPMGSGGIGSDSRYDPWNPYASQLAQQGGGIGSDARYGGQDALASYTAAQNALRGGQGWTIAQQPPAASQGYLANRINQSIYDVGNAGDAYSRMIGGGFGMNMPNQQQGLTAQDLAPRSAYPFGFRMDQQ